jgi:MraZ protein
VEIDDDGRIVLPPKVREKVGMTASEGGEAVLAGSLDTFQLWKADTYEADILRAAEAELAALPGDMDILSLLGDLPEV